MATNEEIMAALQAGDKAPEVKNNYSNEEIMAALSVKTLPPDISRASENEIKDPSWWKSTGDFAAGGNLVASTILGLPGDGYNYISEAMGFESRVPYGTEDIQNKMADFGVTYKAGEEPDTASYKSGKYLGDGLAFLAPITHFGKVKAGISTSAGIWRGVARTLNKPFTEAGKRALAADLVLNASAGAGAYYGGKEYGANGELVGGLAGGFAAAGAYQVAKSGATALVNTEIGSQAIQAGKYVSDFLPVKKVINEIQKILFSYTGRGAKIRLTDIVVGHSEKPVKETLETIQQSKAMLIDGAEGKIPPAQLAKSPYLMALQKKALESNPALAKKMLDQVDEINILAKDELQKIGSGNLEDTQAFISGRSKLVVTMIESEVEKSLAKASKINERIGTSQSRESLHDVTLNALDDALDVAKNNENEAWSKVNNKSKSGLGETFAALIGRPAMNDGDVAVEGALRKLAKPTDEKVIPKYIRNALGDIDLETGKIKPGYLTSSETASVKDMVALRSRINDTIRMAKKDGDYRMINYIAPIQEAILKDLEKSAIGTEYKYAIGISRGLNERFRGGVVGRLFGYDKFNRSADPNVILQGTVNGNGAAGKMLDILAANPGIKDTAEEMLKYKLSTDRRITKVSGDTRTANPEGIDKYIRENAELLDIFPETRDNLVNAAKLQKEADILSKRGKIALEKYRKSAIYSYGEDVPSKAMKRLLEDKSKTKKLSDFKEVYKEPKTREGVKSDFIDYIISNSMTGKKDKHGIKAINGYDLDRVLTENIEIAEFALNAKEFNRLSKVVDTIKLNMVDSGLPSIGDPVKPANLIVNYMIKILALSSGTRVGKYFGAHTMSTAQMAGKNADRFTEWVDTAGVKKMLREVVQDEELFSIAMAHIDTPPKAAKIEGLFGSWLARQAAIELNNSENLPD